MLTENRGYKYADYLIRDKDLYALKKYKMVINWLPKKEHLRVLNAGCGSGEMNILLSQNFTWHVDAIDVDQKAIVLSERMKECYKISNLNLFQSTIEDYRPEEGYDVIVSNDVLEHMPDDELAIRRFYEMLKDRKGILVITVPALPWLFGYHDEMLGHYRRYNKVNLREKLSRYFKVRKCRYFGCSLIPIAFVYSRLLCRPYPVAQNQTKVIRNIISAILFCEQKLSLPIGVSLIAYAIV